MFCTVVILFQLVRMFSSFSRLSNMSGLRGSEVVPEMFCRLRLPIVADKIFCRLHCYLIEV